MGDYVRSPADEILCMSREEKDRIQKRFFEGNRGEESVRKQPKVLEDDDLKKTKPEEQETDCDSVSSNANNNANSLKPIWSLEEEVLLVGVVTERFFAKGSLSGSRKEIAKGGGRSWTEIKEMYDVALTKYSGATGLTKPPDRSPTALARHFKVLRKRDANSSGVPQLFNLWEASYADKYGLVPECNEAKDDDAERSSSLGRWSFVEEVLLVGVVTEAFLDRGSLCSSFAERSGSAENILWKAIHEKFDAVRKAALNGTRQDFRTVKSLTRHFKVMKTRVIFKRTDINLKSYYRIWQRHYKKFYDGMEGNTINASEHTNAPEIPQVQTTPTTQAPSLPALPSQPETTATENTAMYSPQPIVTSIAGNCIVWLPVSLSQLPPGSIDSTNNNNPSNANN